MNQRVVSKQRHVRVGQLWVQEKEENGELIPFEEQAEESGKYLASVQWKKPRNDDWRNIPTHKIIHKEITYNTSAPTTEEVRKQHKNTKETQRPARMKYQWAFQRIKGRSTKRDNRNAGRMVGKRIHTNA